MNRDIPGLFEKIRNGDRVALGQSMTLVESDLKQDRIDAVALLNLCEDQTKNIQNSLRIAVSGAPGVGKSTLIEALGLKAISLGQTVGVITIDPTSNISHGSILGDKSRMQRLSHAASAFVRTSPAGTLLGGIGRRSNEMMVLLAAAGFEIIILETVGVGQSEHIAWQLTDGFILVIQPGSGDELQGIKRGITELADIIVINKSDGPLKEMATNSRSHFQNALNHLSRLRMGWEPKVLTCSALSGDGIDELWENIRLYMESRLENNQLSQERIRQDTFWLSWSLGITAHELLMEHPVVNQKLSEGLLNIRNQQTSLFKTEFEIENVMKEIITSAVLQNK